jgi:hypothetical protein
MKQDDDEVLIVFFFYKFRTNNFYALGLSLGAILDITNPVDYIKALSQIMSEFERHTSDDSKQKMVKIKLVSYWRFL